MKLSNSVQRACLTDVARTIVHTVTPHFGDEKGEMP